MKKQKKKMYNWHFWVPQYQIQVIVLETCYAKANSKIKGIFKTFNNFDNIKIQFQFGQLDY